jgi:hypothetical protein
VIVVVAVGDNVTESYSVRASRLTRGSFASQYTPLKMFDQFNKGSRTNKNIPKFPKNKHPSEIREGS